MISSPISAALPVPRAAISSRAAFGLLASLSVSFLAGSSAPTPLYAEYQARWGFSPIMTTVAFGVYALAVLGSLLSFGRLSDHIGRRPVLLVAVLIQLFSMLLFATASGQLIPVLAPVPEPRSAMFMTAGLVMLMFVAASARRRSLSRHPSLPIA